MKKKEGRKQVVGCSQKRPKRIGISSVVESAQRTSLETSPTSSGEKLCHRNLNWTNLRECFVRGVTTRGEWRRLTERGPILVSILCIFVMLDPFKE